MLEKIASKEPKTTAELFELADKVARKEEAWAWNSPGTGAAAAATPESAPRSKRRDRRGKRKPARSDDEDHVLAADGPTRAPRKGKATGDKPSPAVPSGEGRSADKWCSVHNTYRHSLADCRSVKNLAERFRKADEENWQGRREGKAPATSTGDRRGEAKDKGPADDGGDGEDLDFQIPQGTVATLDGGACAHASRRSFKAMKRELLAVVPTHEAVRKARCLSIISPAAFDALKAPGMKLQPSLPINGVTLRHTWPLGHVELPVTFGDSTNFHTERIDFDVADLNLPYNAVLGRPALVKFMVATHYAYLQMKMLGPAGPITVLSDVKVALACAEQRADNLAVATEPQAQKPLRPALPRSASPRLTREVIEHRLAVRPDARPVRQKVRRQAPERQAFIREEVARLLEADFIREVIHPEWLANPVVVPKTNGKLRMCIDYTDLNKACPKDPFPLPRIDQIIDSTAGCNLLCFLEAYSGYHQIRAGVTLTSPNGDVLKYVVCLDFRATNNMAEYEGLLAGLRATAGMGIRRLLVLGDSQLVINQVSKEYQCTDSQMEAYVHEVRRMERHFDGLELRHVPRRDNTIADELSRVASARAPLPPGTFEERLAQPSARPSPLRDPNDTPTDPTPGDPRPSGPEGVNPDPPHQVVWMTDIRAYLEGNTHPEDRAEAEKLARISKQYQHLYVAIDKFTKWPVAYPVVKIDKHSALKFIKGITSRFGVPNCIITDNGTQFTSELFGDYCDDMGIKLCFASPAHPKSNGQVERANAEILKGLKTKTYNVLKKHGDSWLEELPTVLWENRTTPSRATGETPFFLVYGAEAVLPSELSLGSPRVVLYNEANQDDLCRDDLDYLEEQRRGAALRAARYQQSLRRYHQRHVRARSLQVGDLVLRRVQSRLGLSKLSPMWEGPYKVIKVPRPGSVRLTMEDGTELPNPWNIEHLRRFYP
ncbi:uncharacterized protein [Oryza sativa Japonica Group]|uniref:uncharacterized protein n=1 Tax=Oryza sativa subsp. japonica TaxID=39947 RepID=UPI00339BFC84